MYKHPHAFLNYLKLGYKRHSEPKNNFSEPASIDDTQVKDRYTYNSSYIKTSPKSTVLVRKYFI